MGRRKKDESGSALTMNSQKAAPEIFEPSDPNDTMTDLETLATEEAEQLADSAEDSDEAQTTETQPKRASRPRRQRRPRKRPEMAVEESAPIASDAVEPTLPSPESRPVAAPAAPLALPAIDSVPLALTETAISSRVLNQMTRQIDPLSAANDPNQLVKQLNAVKEISVSICSQLDRMTATLIELQNKHSSTILELQKEKAAPKRAKIPVWLAATSALAITLSIVSMSLTQATRHAVFSSKTEIPAHLLTGIRPAAAAEVTANNLPQARVNSPSKAIAKKDQATSRRQKR